MARLLRPHRARHRVRRREPEDARAQERRRLGAERQQDVDLARHPRRSGDDLRPDRPRAEAPRPRLLPRPDRHARLQHPGDPRQDGPARVGHRVDRARRRRGARRRDDGRGRRGLQDRDERARLRPLFGRRRLRRRLPGLARPLGRLRQGARAVRPADRVVPARAGDDRRHARADRRRAPAGVPRRLPEGPGQAEHDRDLDRQAVRHRGGAELLAPGDPGPRRLRLRRRPPGRALLPRRARDHALRGHVARSRS